LDTQAGLNGLIYGHNNPQLKHALLNYIERDGLPVGVGGQSEAEARFMRTLTRRNLTPRQLTYRVALTEPGEAQPLKQAMTLAKDDTGRDTVVTLQPKISRRHFGWQDQGPRHYQDDHIVVSGLADLRRWLGSSASTPPAAVIIETVQRHTGMRVLSDRWLRAAQQLCHAHGVLLVFNETLAGCGRTGRFFSFEASGVQPDLACAPPSPANAPTHDHALITAATALDIYWSDVQFESHVQKQSAQLTAELRALVRMCPEVFLRRTGRGMVQGMQCRTPDMARRIIEAGFREGVLLNTVDEAGTVLALCCPLTLNSLEREQLIARLRAAAYAARHAGLGAQTSPA
jgi:diaminobutyrate-2-oxoglutarate transaminase